MQKSGIIRKIATYFAFFCLLFWVGFPVYFMLITSFMRAPELGAKPPHWIPPEPTVENYREVLIGKAGEVGGYGSTTEFTRMMPALLNSTFVSVAVVLSNLLIGGMAAYAFSRFRFPAIARCLLWDSDDTGAASIEPDCAAFCHIAKTEIGEHALGADSHLYDLHIATDHLDPA